jgi:hypothetical protein
MLSEVVKIGDDCNGAQFDGGLVGVAGAKARIALNDV